MGNRIPLIAGNWKMYKAAAEASDIVVQLADIRLEAADRDIMVAPLFIVQEAAPKTIGGTDADFEAQNLNRKQSKANTGENATDTPKAAGYLRVIIGHFEQAQNLNGIDKTVDKKIALSFSQKFITKGKPIVFTIKRIFWATFGTIAITFLFGFGWGCFSGNFKPFFALAEFFGKLLNEIL